ncbi:hypothetical protein E4U55_005795 [Claviceps digitariae]|nr:hypothetical protein E4U55_005795 [Claviceps digitariae]
MKFANPFLALTAVSGAYCLVIPRDGTDVVGVLNGVQSAIDNLDNAVQGWTTDPEETLDASTKLIKTIKDGVKTADGSAPLNLIDAVMLLGPLHTLNTHAQALVDDLKAKKTQIESQGLCDAVRGQIDEMDTSSKELVDHTLSKIPQYVQSIGKGAAQPILDTIGSAKDAFSEENCGNKS